MYHYPDSFSTERLQTRKLVYEDYKTWTRFFEDEATVKFFPNTDAQTNEERSKVWLDKTINRYNNNQYGLHALLEKATGKFIGQCGLMTQEVNDIKEIEIGYHLFPEYRGKGYAMEAAQFFRDWGFNNKASDSIISIIHPENFPSQNVAKRNGMSCEKETLWRNMKVFIFRLNYKQWQNTIK